MKKLIILLLVLSGCNCDLSKKSLQPEVKSIFIYAGADCSAPIPDYTEVIKPTDNCKLAWLVQDPSPGWLLTPDNMTMTVTIRAGDASGNFSEVSFTVTLLDTIKPVFNIDPSFFLASWEAIDRLYDQGDRILKEMAFNDKILNADTDFLPYQVGNSYFEGVERKTYSVRNASTSMGVTTWNLDGVDQIDSSFLAKTLIIRVPPAGRRTYTFE